MAKFETQQRIAIYPVPVLKPGSGSLVGIDKTSAYTTIGDGQLAFRAADGTRLDCTTVTDCQSFKNYPQIYISWGVPDGNGGHTQTPVLADRDYVDPSTLSYTCRIKEADGSIVITVSTPAAIGDPIRFRVKFSNELLEKQATASYLDVAINHTATSMNATTEATAIKDAIQKRIDEEDFPWYYASVSSSGAAITIKSHAIPLEPSPSNTNVLNRMTTIEGDAVEGCTLTSTTHPKAQSGYGLAVRNEQDANLTGSGFTLLPRTVGGLPTDQRTATLLDKSHWSKYFDIFSFEESKGPLRKIWRFYIENTLDSSDSPTGGKNLAVLWLQEWLSGANISSPYGAITSGTGRSNFAACSSTA